MAECVCHVCSRLSEWTDGELRILVEGGLLARDLHVSRAAAAELGRRRKAGTDA